MNLLACIDQNTSVSAQSYYGKNSDTRPIIQRHLPTYNTSGQYFNGYERKNIRNNFFRNKKRAAAQILGKGQLGFRPM